MTTTRDHLAHTRCCVMMRSWTQIKLGIWSRFRVVRNILLQEATPFLPAPDPDWYVSWSMIAYSPCRPSQIKHINRLHKTIGRLNPRRFTLSSTTGGKQKRLEPAIVAR
jgi:hypothetical protein